MNIGCHECIIALTILCAVIASICSRYHFKLKVKQLELELEVRKLQDNKNKKNKHGKS